MVVWGGVLTWSDPVLTYSGVPLAELSGVPRGKTLTSLARQIDAERHLGAQIADAVAGVRVDGGKRAQVNAPYDWQRNGKRIACKSSQLTWDKSNRYWQLLFNNVKLAYGYAPAAFDELLLAAYTPRGVYLYRHDLRFGVTTHGKRTAATAGEATATIQRPGGSTSLPPAPLRRRIPD